MTGHCLSDKRAAGWVEPRAFRVDGGKMLPSGAARGQAETRAGISPSALAQKYDRSKPQKTAPQHKAGYKEIGHAHLLQPHTGEAVIWLRTALNHTQEPPTICGLKLCRGSGFRLGYVPPAQIRPR